MLKSISAISVPPWLLSSWTEIFDILSRVGKPVF
jgi:hypothetical protein